MKRKDDLTEFEKEVIEALNKPTPRKSFEKRLRADLVEQPGTTREVNSWGLKPAWALGIATLIALVVIGGTPRIANAIQNLFRYIPAIGLVEQSQEMLALPEPVSQTRDGITVSLKEAIASDEQLRISYQVEGIPAEDAFDPTRDLGAEDSFCLGKESYPRLVFSDGSEIQAEPQILGGSWEEGLSSYTAGHLFSGLLPDKAKEADLVFSCLRGLPKDEAPENWLLAFSLNTVEDTAQLGKEVTQTADAKNSDAGITLAAEMLIKEEDGYVFYTDLFFDQTAPSQLSVFPKSTYVYDASGEQFLVSYIFNHGPWDVRNADTPVVFKTSGIPDEGDLTLVVDKATAFFSPDTNQNVAGSMFTFEAGDDPQVGQRWNLEETFSAGGYEFELVSAKLIEKDGRQGYQFSFQSTEPGMKMGVDLIESENRNLWTAERSPADANFTGTLLYDGEVPSTVNVTINWVSVVIDGHWEVSWKQIAD